MRSVSYRLSASRNTQQYPIRPKQTPGLRTAKAWSSHFFERRVFRDRPFIDAHRENGVELDAHIAWLQNTDATGTIWEVEEVLKFLSRPTTAVERIWLHCRVEGPEPLSTENAEHESSWRTTSNFSNIITPPRMQPSTHTSVRRSLIFVPILTPRIVTTLVEAATCYQAQCLRTAIRGHVAGRTSISVSAPPGVGYAYFRLELHLPYVVLRESESESPGIPDTNLGQSQMLWPDLGFLQHRSRNGHQGKKYSISAAHTSVVIAGAHNFDWYGYAFGNTGPGDPVAHEYEEPEDGYRSGNDEGTDEWFHEREEDYFLAGGCLDISTAGQPIMDPRVYFLRSVQHRVHIMAQSYEYLVRKLEAWVKSHDGHLSDNQDICDSQLKWSLHCIEEMTKLSSHLHQHLHIAIDVWQRFSGPRGDILYFEGLQDGNACDALQKIEESFELMENLVMVVNGMEKTCSKASKVFRLQLKLGKHGMRRRMTDATWAAATSANKSQKFAEDMSRLTRVNVQLLTVTTAVVISLQYFCSERALFDFERSPRMFWVSLCVLVPGFVLLTYFLHVMDQVKTFLTDRLNGESEKAGHQKTELTTVV